MLTLQTEKIRTNITTKKLCLSEINTTIYKHGAVAQTMKV